MRGEPALCSRVIPLLAPATSAFPHGCASANAFFHPSEFRLYEDVTSLRRTRKAQPRLCLSINLLRDTSFPTRILSANTLALCPPRTPELLKSQGSLPTSR